jgi:Terminase small subunit
MPPKGQKLPLETIKRMRQAKLSLKQKRFVEGYAASGNGAEAAREAGYSAKTAYAISSENLRKPHIAQALEGELARIAADYSPGRVKRRLHEISYAAQSDGQYGPAVRCEELLGKAAGMWIDQSLQLSGVLSDSHVAALLEHAKRRTVERIDNRDEDDDD